jgi:hypothetical protein
VKQPFTFVLSTGRLEAARREWIRATDMRLR